MFGRVTVSYSQYVFFLINTALQHMTRYNLPVIIYVKCRVLQDISKIDEKKMK